MEKNADKFFSKNQTSKLSGSSFPIFYKDLPQDDPKIRKPDITRAKNILGWEPKFNLEEGLKKTLISFGVKVL